MGCGMEHGPGYGCHEHGGFGGGKKTHHTCPTCGMPHGAKAEFGATEADLGSCKLVKKAVKKLLMEKTKAKIDARWGDKLDAVAQELVDMAEEKMKLKKEMWKHKKEMKERMHEILAEEMEEED